MARTRGTITQFFTGVGYLFRGFGTWRTAPGLMLLGMVPALIVGALFLAGFIALGLNIDTLARSVTPFATDWDEPLRSIIRVVASLAFIGAAVLIVVFTFTTITLIVGQPFYERISKHVDQQLGGVPDAVDSGFWRALGDGIVDGLRMLIPTVFIGAALLVLGFIPLVGTALAAVLGALVGGWYLAIELTGTPFDARGRSLRERRALLRARRPTTLGFGVVTYLLFLVPLGAVLVMPAAVAGAALLARSALGESTRSGPTSATRTTS